MIRAIPSNASDNVYCTLLAHSVVHGAMAGYTGFTVGSVNGRHAYIPFHVSLGILHVVSCLSLTSGFFPIRLTRLVHQYKITNGNIIQVIQIIYWWLVSVNCNFCVWVCSSDYS